MNIKNNIIVLIVAFIVCAGCHSPDYTDTFIHPSVYGRPVYMHRSIYHYDHYDHHYHHRRSNNNSSRSSGKVITPTRNPTPPPSRPITKGVPDPPSHPRDRR